MNGHNINLNDIQVKKELEINGNFINNSSDSDNSEEMPNEAKTRLTAQSHPSVDNSGLYPQWVTLSPNQLFIP